MSEPGDRPGPSFLLNETADLFEETEGDGGEPSSSSSVMILEVEEDEEEGEERVEGRQRGKDDERDGAISVDLFDTSTPSPIVVMDCNPVSNSGEETGSGHEVRGEERMNLRDVLERVNEETMQSEVAEPELQEPVVDMRLLETDEDRSMLEELDQSLAKLQQVELAGAKSFAHYMQLKKDKLRYQVNVLSKPLQSASNIFKGVSIFVNGHTVPTALELRKLIQAHGGQYHCYMEYGRTTYTVASHLAAAKVDKVRANEVFIRPDWILDSISAGRALPIEEYRLLDEKSSERKMTSFFAKGKGAESAETVGTPILLGTSAAEGAGRFLDARDPDFIQQYYARSRLHLISTLAQEMKDFVGGMREEEGRIFEGRSWAEQLRGHKGPCEPVIMHVDIDCFFVSVALRERRDLEGRAVAVTHSKGSTASAGLSEIASCSYAARAAGVKNGMMVCDALKLCPSLVCLPYQFEEYKTVSKTIYSIITSYTLEVRAVSCDEMFVDFSGLCRDLLVNDPCTLAEQIRGRICDETGCAASVGIGPSVVIARLATRHAKPDGVRWVREDDVIQFISREKVENLPGVGRTMIRKLEEHFGEMDSCARLQSISQSELEGVLGKSVGQQIYKLCRGRDDSSKEDFLASNQRKSVSCDINYGIRFTKRDELLDFLSRISLEVSHKLSQCNMICSSLTLKLMIRSADAPLETAKYMGHGRCDTVSRSTVLRQGTADAKTLTQESIRLFDQLGSQVCDLRGIGLHCGRLQSSRADRRGAVQAMKTFFAARKKNEGKEEGERKEKRKRKEDDRIEDGDEDEDERMTERMDESSRDSYSRDSAPGPSTAPLRSRTIPIVRGEKIIPIVSIPLEEPSFFGLTNPYEIRRRMKEMLREAPLESSVHSLLDFLLQLLHRGRLCLLRALSLYLVRLSLATSPSIDPSPSPSIAPPSTPSPTSPSLPPSTSPSIPTTHPLWLPAVFSICQSIDDVIKSSFRAPLLMPAIEQIQF